MYNITILYGAIREGRLSIRAAKALEHTLTASGKANVTLIDIKEYDLPVMTSRFRDMDNPSEGLVFISNALNNADGIILASPEYNGSYSGALKNAVDYFTKEWAKKPIGICCSSSGRLGGVNASHHLQSLILSIGAFPMPYKLLVNNLETTIDEAGNPQEEHIKQSLSKFVEEYLWFVSAISNQKKSSNN